MHRRTPCAWLGPKSIDCRYCRYQSRVELRGSRPCSLCCAARSACTNNVEGGFCSRVVNESSVSLTGCTFINGPHLLQCVWHRDAHDAHAFVSKPTDLLRCMNLHGAGRLGHSSPRLLQYTSASKCSVSRSSALKRCHSNRIIQGSAMTTVTEQEDPGRLERGPDRSQLGGQASGARPPSHAQKPCRAPQHEGKPPLPG